MKTNFIPRFCIITLIVLLGVGFTLGQADLVPLVAQLQKTPTDNALREKVIKLAASMKPAPDVPEDARRPFVRANTAIKTASTQDDYARAIKQYQEALALAPWWGDAYYNLARAQELRQEYDASIQSLKFYLMTSPTTADAREEQDHIYALEEMRDKKTQADKKSADDAAKAAAEKEKNKPTVEGNWTLVFFEFRIVRKGDVYYITDQKMNRRPGGWKATDVSIDAQHVQLTAVQDSCSTCDAKYDLTLSESGNELVGKIWTASAGWTTALPGTRLL